MSKESLRLADLWFQQNSTKPPRKHIKYPQLNNKNQLQNQNHLQNHLPYPPPTPQKHKPNKQTIPKQPPSPTNHPKKKTKPNKLPVLPPPGAARQTTDRALCWARGKELILAVPGGEVCWFWVKKNNRKPPGFGLFFPFTIRFFWGVTFFDLWPVGSGSNTTSHHQPARCFCWSSFMGSKTPASRVFVWRDFCFLGFHVFF